MNAIIIAAGSGKRISHEVTKTPKSLVKVNNKPIIDYQISILKQAGIQNIIIITGPYHEKFQLTDVQYVQDLNYDEHDILGSLMEARNFLKNDILILYSDILFDLQTIQEILVSDNDISIGVELKKVIEKQD